jgi:hypothetical protein
MKREKAETNDELREQLYGPFSRGNIWPGREEVTFCQRRHYDGASPFSPKCKGAFFHNICTFPFSFSSMGWAWARDGVCARVREGRQGERASWGFVYDFVRCSFDALFAPEISINPFLLVCICRGCGTAAYEHDFSDCQHPRCTLAWISQYLILILLFDIRYAHPVANPSAVSFLPK